MTIPDVAGRTGPGRAGPGAGRDYGLAAHRLAVTGLAGIGIATLLEVVMQMVPGGRRLDPLTATISAFALEPGGWLFSVGVIILAVASTVLGAALLVARLVSWRQPWAIWYALWCIGLVGLTVITKTEIGPNSSVQSRIHWSFTLLAFVSLPLAVLLIVRELRRRARTEHLRLPRPLRAATVLMWIAVGWFVLLAGQSALSVLHRDGLFPWVGLIERGVAVTEMAAVVCLGWWVIHERRAVLAAFAEQQRAHGHPEAATRRTQRPRGDSR